MIVNELIRSTLRRRDSSGTLDSANDSSGPSMAADWTTTHITMLTAASIQQWAETDDLDDGESCADRLMALFIGIADANGDGALTEDEYTVLDVALNAARAYLVKCNAAEGDIDALLNFWNPKSASRVKYAVASALAAGIAGTDIDDFAFSDGGQVVALDGVLHTLGRAIAHGAKALRWKRATKHEIGAPLHKMLTAKQLAALGKARRKSHSASAQAKRLKTLREMGRNVSKGNSAHKMRISKKIRAVRAGE